MSSSRVTPARAPEDSGGVHSRPLETTNTLEPVPSQSWSRVFARRASSPPTRWAWASATTFSAYDVVLSPAIADRSLRTHGTMATDAVAGQTFAGATVTRTVGVVSPRSLPSGPAPLVTVI